MTNHRNGLTIAGLNNSIPTRKPAPDQRAADLARRFSFQPYSESNHDDRMRLNTQRRALLDKRLLEEVYERIAMQPQLETRELVLQAHNGVVTVDGCVADRAMRAQIGKFIRHCSCVKKVINRIRIMEVDGEHESAQMEAGGSACRRLGMRAIAA